MRPMLASSLPLVPDPDLPAREETLTLPPAEEWMEVRPEWPSPAVWWLLVLAVGTLAPLFLAAALAAS